jgi:CheY-like chemotaxis protein
MTGYNFSHLSVLVVDDHLPMRTLLGDILRSLGFSQILFAPSGESALDLLAERPIDILITDEHMEPMSGVDLVRMVRLGHNGINPFIPVIMISADTAMNLIRAARDVGVTEFLAKPISAERLFCRVRAVIEHPRPFIRTATFFGPDRRRRKMPFANGDRRLRPYSYNGGRERVHARAS